MERLGKQEMWDSSDGAVRLGKQEAVKALARLSTEKEALCSQQRGRVGTHHCTGSCTNHPAGRNAQP